MEERESKFNFEMEENAIEEVSLEVLLENGDTPSSLIQTDVWTEEEWDNVDMQLQFQELMERMTELERKVFTLRFGLGGGEAKSLEEVALILGVTRERVRQIEVKAIHRLSRHRVRRIKRLKDSLD